MTITYSLPPFLVLIFEEISEYTAGMFLPSLPFSPRNEFTMIGEKEFPFLNYAVGKDTSPFNNEKI